MTVISAERPESVIRWNDLLFVVRRGGYRSDDRGGCCSKSMAVEFHPCCSSPLWTGIDLFMGFVLGPILRSVDLPIRREIAKRLTPRTLFVMPVLSIISGTTGWFLAVELGYTALAWPAYGYWLDCRIAGADHAHDNSGPGVSHSGQRIGLP